jgi:hypothetical protein
VVRVIGPGGKTPFFYIAPESNYRYVRAGGAWRCFNARYELQGQQRPTGQKSPTKNLHLSSWNITHVPRGWELVRPCGGIRSFEASRVDRGLAGGVYIHIFLSFSSKVIICFTVGPAPASNQLSALSSYM